MQSYKNVLNLTIKTNNIVKYLSINNYFTYLFLTCFVYRKSAQNIHKIWRFRISGFTTRLECDLSLM